MNSPFFAVIMPIYNRASFLPGSVTSVLNQDFRDFELICVDDGSTDQSVEIIEQFVKQDKRLKLIRHPKNFGRCASRNSGIQNASAEWICFLDSDDLYLENHLSVLFKLISEYTAQNAFATSFLRSSDLSMNSKRKLKEKNSLITLNDVIHSNILSPPNILCYNKNKISTTFAKENIPVSEDWLFVRILLTKTDVIKSSLQTTILTEHPGRTMNSENIKEIVQWNEYAGLLFAGQHGLKKSVSDTVKSHTFLLCANLLVSNGFKPDSTELFKKSLRFWQTFSNPLFYKYITKYLLK
jgi:glycosyltransferase involved in cell wall biosynthesis